MGFEMTKPLILVTGSTGKTGTHVVQLLRQRGLPVRALARRLDERTTRLAALGAEVVIGDFMDPESLRTAAQDADGIYFCYPPQGEQLIEATTNIVVAAMAAGVRAIVNLSQISALEGSQSPLARQHWLAERILDWSPVGAVHLRPTFFAEMLFILGGQTIAADGKLYLPYGDQKHAPVTAQDIARVAVGVLADPAEHIGKSYVVTGPRDMTIDEMTEVIGEELGKRVDYVQIPLDMWERILVDQVGLPPFLSTHLKAVAVDHQNGVFSAQTDVVERIGGRPPQSLGEFVHQNRAQFS
ncbi:MAG: NAD(P)H dehydrogenase (quinone) [Myxococcota bacterium]|jgi:NAD(P)H dehydrogenase (quinone)